MEGVFDGKSRRDKGQDKQMNCIKKLLTRLVVCIVTLFAVKEALSDASFPVAPYIVINLSHGGTYTIGTLDAIPDGGWTDEYKTTKLVLRRIEPDGETLKKPYYIGVFETTRMQYALIAGQELPDAETSTLPAANVSYMDLRGSSETADWPLFTNVDEGSIMWTLRQKTGLAFDLPTEAQWEYACRAGTDGSTQWNDGSAIEGTSTDTNLNQLALYGGNNTNGTAAVVGSYNPNGWGLYDMHGNVGEWCLDWYGTMANGIIMDGEPVGCLSGTSRALRGGYYRVSALSCRSTARLSTNPSRGYTYFGFRLVVRQSSVENEDVVAVSFNAQSGSVSELKRKYNRGASLGVLPVPVRSGYIFEGWFTAVEGGAKKTATDCANVTQTLFAHWVYRTDNLYMVVDLSEGPSATSYPITYLSQVPEGGWTDEYKTEKLVLRRIDAGTFIMGSPTTELGRKANSTWESQHRVTLTESYYIGVFEFTQRQEQLITGNNSYNDSTSKGDNKPALGLWYTKLRGMNVGTNWPSSSEVDASSVMGRLRGKTGLMFDLPTEAQWEYACRAGTTTALNSGVDFMRCTKTSSQYSEQEVLAEQREITKYNADLLCEVARCSFNNYSGTNFLGAAVVGSYRPNAWGLYDMHGNVQEWCLDWSGYYPSGSVIDPKGAESSERRILRGGPWAHRTSYGGGGELRSAARATNYPGSTYTFMPYDGCRIAVQDTALVEAAVVTVAFNPNGGTVDQTARTYADGSVFGTLPVPTRTSGTFLGWFTALTGGTEVTAESRVSGSATIYAHWDVLEPEVTTTNVPHDWLRAHGYSNDFETAAVALTGKRDGSGRALTVADDYIMGTDPAKSNDVFTARLTFSNDVPHITWSPNLNTNGIVRTYTVLGKTNLTDTVDWAPTNAHHRFFKVLVELP